MEINGENVSIGLACVHVYGYLFWINDWYGRACPTVGSAASVQVLLGCIRKQTEHVSEQHSSTPSASVPASGSNPVFPQ